MLLGKEEEYYRRCQVEFIHSLLIFCSKTREETVNPMHFFHSAGFSFILCFECVTKDPFFFFYGLDKCLEKFSFMSGIDRRFHDPSKQQDVQEFLRFLLSHLHDLEKSRRKSSVSATYFRQC